MQPTSVRDVIAVLGNPREWDATWQYHVRVPRAQIRRHGDVAWVDLPEGTWYAAVLADPADTSDGDPAAPLVLLVDDAPTSVDVVPALHARLLAHGWQPVPAQPRTPVPVPPRLVHVSLLLPATAPAAVPSPVDTDARPTPAREQWYRSRVWVTDTAAPLQHLHLHDATGAVIPVVCLEMHAPPAWGEPAALTAVLDPDPAMFSPAPPAAVAAGLASSPAWAPMPTPAGAAQEPWVTRAALAGAVFTQVAHLLGAPVIVGVRVDPLEALAQTPGWAVHLPGDLVDEIVAVLWDAGRDDLLPHDTP